MNRRFVALAAALTGMILSTSSLSAEPARVGEISVEQPWARASIGRSRPAAAYFTVRNEGGEPDRLTAMASPAAGMAEIHTMTNENGVMRMHPAGPQEIPPDGRLVLKPGGLHVMLMQLREPLVEGDTVSLELTFEQAGTVTVNAPILGPGATHPPE